MLAVLPNRETPTLRLQSLSPESARPALFSAACNAMLVSAKIFSSPPPSKDSFRPWKEHHNHDVADYCFAGGSTFVADREICH
jgi:hypothetical protein